MNNITTSVATDIFSDMQACHLSSAERFIYLTLFTQSDRSITSIYTYSAKMIALLTALTEKTVKSALDELKECGLILRDGCEVYVQDFFRSNALQNKKTYRCYLADLNKIRSENFIDIMMTEHEDDITYTFAAALADCKFHRATHKEWTEEQFILSTPF